MIRPQPPFVLLPSDCAERIEAWGSWGPINVQSHDSERLMVVQSVGDRQIMALPTHARWSREHYLSSATVVPIAGWWYEVDPQLHDLHIHLLRRSGVGVATDLIRGAVKGSWHFPPENQPIPILTCSRDGEGCSSWSMWWVSRTEATPGPMEVVADVSPLSDLAGAWPVDVLQNSHIVVVGLGSIGSVVAETLADFAVGKLTLVDPDRLLRHNVVRHRLGVRDIGRFKVNAMAEYLSQRHRELEIDPWPANVISEADIMRPLFRDADLVIGATDGVAARQVINHLARRAGTSLVLACVLENGALGEILRLRPQTGCLSCHRRNLEESGQMNPEPALDRGYGFGDPHLPMTAVGGDLVAVGVMAAKVAVATLLERKGHWNQRLPGDAMTIGLQPVPDAGPPFDIERAGDIRWSFIGPIRSDCLTCAEP